MEETREKPTPPPLAIAIDGTRIKGIREAKKLTQLYVANVVGVTTDTISRWENNRYPSIKRDNAEKLAAALEVTLGEIIRQEEEAPPSVMPEQPPLPQPSHRRWTLVAGGVLFLALVLALFLSRRLTGSPTAVRTLPPLTAPGSIIPVQVKLSRAPSSGKGYILKEQLPTGWRLVSANPPVPTGKGPADEAKWLLPAIEGEQTVSYTVQVPQGLPLKGKASFAGSLVTHTGGGARTEAVGGARTVTIADRHWADLNGDARIDDSEIMPAYYRCEEMKGLGLDWKSIEEIWNGKGYRWDPHGNTFTVIK